MSGINVIPPQQSTGFTLSGSRHARMAHLASSKFRFRSLCLVGSLYYFIPLSALDRSIPVRALTGKMTFQWGVAGAAYQIEGAHDADGKARSIWDDFCKVPGAISDGTSAEVACDFYHRYEEDIELARAAGFKHFRMSISWPRVIRD